MNITDTERIDWMQKQTKGHGKGWVFRQSVSGRGMRLHESAGWDARGTIRAAIDAAMKEGDDGDS